MDLTENLITLKKSGLEIHGMYGTEDGLYSKEQINDLISILGNKRLLYLENCSHSVYIDQQAAFINGLNNWLKD